jgi:hypothetical protein
MQLLQDIFIIEKLQVLNEGAAKDTMKIRGVFGRCNEKNNNGRIYPTTVLESQLKKVQPLIQERRLCGELDHPSNDTVKLSNASHLITKLEIKGNELIGEAEILKTPAGLTAKALIDGGVRIGISSRGMGTLSEDAQGNKIVNEDYRLVTFDLVADPSTRGAFPSLAESTQSRFARESQTKLQKESNFVTLLKSRLREEYDLVLTEKRNRNRPQPPPPQTPPPPPPPPSPSDTEDEEEDDKEVVRRPSRERPGFKDTGSYWGNLRSSLGQIYHQRALAAEKERQAKAKEPKAPLGQRIGSFARKAVRAPGEFLSGLKKGWAGEHTEYHRIGLIIAESMGLIDEARIVTGRGRLHTGVKSKVAKRYKGMIDKKPRSGKFQIGKLTTYTGVGGKGGPTISVTDEEED